MKKALSVLLALALGLTILTGCQSGGASSGGGASTSGVAQGGETVKFAVLAPITGNYAEFGTAFKVATKMAADEINAAGGVNGRQIVLDVYDGKALIFFGNRAILITSEIVFLRM